MNFSIPKNCDKSLCLDSLADWLNKKYQGEPIYQSFPKYNMQYLGFYLLEENDHFNVFDLYFYNGSSPKQQRLIAKHGDSLSDYISDTINSLSQIKNNDLKMSPVGESYRRYKKRKPVIGYIRKE